MIAGIAIPVSLEFILILVLNFISQVIVGVLGATAIAAVGFANSLVFILVVTFGAMGVSVSILVARAFGGQRRSEMSHTVTAALVIAGLLTLLGMLVPLLAPTQLLTAVGASPSVAAVGAEYLRLNAISMLPLVLVAILSGAMRSTGYARSPMIATIVTVPLNVVLAYVLVLGVGPAPDLGVAGAGWAVLVTSTIKLLILLVLAFAVHRIFDWSLPESVVQWRAIVTPLIVLALPLAITELLWSGGTFLYNVVAQQLGDAQLAAAQIVTTLEGVFMVGSIGLMSATTALVGRSVGEHDAPGAAHWVARLTRAGMFTGIAFGVLFAASAIAVPGAVRERRDRGRDAGGDRHPHERRLPGGQGAQHDPGRRRHAQRGRRQGRHPRRRGERLPRGAAAGDRARPVHAAGPDRDLHRPDPRGGREARDLHAAHATHPVGGRRASARR